MIVVIVPVTLLFTQVCDFREFSYGLSINLESLSIDDDNNSSGVKFWLYRTGSVSVDPGTTVREVRDRKQPWKWTGGTCTHRWTP